MTMIFELFAYPARSWNGQKIRLCLSILFSHIMRCVIDLITWGALRLEVVGLTVMLFTYGAVKYLFQPVTQKITIAFPVLKWLGKYKRAIQCKATTQPYHLQLMVSHIHIPPPFFEYREQLSVYQNKNEKMMCRKWLCTISI